jgi:Cu(I)/Ag(I) efflux system membrane fusion protein
MKNKGICLLWIILITVSIIACKQKPLTAVSQAQNKTYYTCSMHPQIHEDHPGDCPICGMKLIKIELEAANANVGSDHITLTAAQIKLAGIQTDTVREQNISDEKTITGTVTTNENKAEQLSARIAGRMQQLFVRTIGEKIASGQPIYAIYSEDLLEAEKEYLLARQQQKILNNPDVDYRRLVDAAENKLLLWGVSPAQIRNIALTGKTSASTIVLSKINGTVSDIAVHEGDYVTAGMPILKTQGLNSLWIEGQLYAGETGTYHENDRVNVSLPELNGQVITGKIDFINPELSGSSKVDLIRVSISNPQGLVRPGMMAYISLVKGNQRAIAVSASSILASGKGDMVWIKNADSSFSPKMVTLGAGNSNYVPVLSGLHPGDVVVTTGVYLLNSESIFKNGDKAMGGMKM